MIWVAPHLGARIEMQPRTGQRSRVTGRTLRGCVNRNCKRVRQRYNTLPSHPVRVRESKRLGVFFRFAFDGSHPARVRESKFGEIQPLAQCTNKVAPHTGARIEIWWQMRFALMSRRCRTLRGCANQNSLAATIVRTFRGRTLRGRANQNDVQAVAPLWVCKLKTWESCRRKPRNRTAVSSFLSPKSAYNIVRKLMRDKTAGLCRVLHFEQ